MQLTAFRIRKYRNIEDSGLVRLADRLTCIVGKNQSGKTNLLKGLQKLNPRDTSVKYDARSDWPRGGRRARDQSQVVCEAHFDLSGTEQQGLAALGDPGATAATVATVVVTKNYAGDYGVAFPDHAGRFPDRAHPAAVDRVCAKLALPATPVGEEFTRAAGTCIAEVKQLAQRGKFAEIAKLTEAHREALDNAGSVNHPHHENEANFISAYLKLLPQISAELAALPTIARQARDYVIQHFRLSSTWTKDFIVHNL